jgi:predicted nucleic acid-binding protein
MSYLVDTNVLSELRRLRPNAAVVSWVAARPVATLYLSVLTLGEIRKGVQAVADPIHRQRLLDWLQVELPAFFAGRLLPVDAAVADRWGRLQALAARPLPAIDSLLAATALEHDLVLVTRNLRDFAGLPVQVFNPWTLPS